MKKVMIMMMAILALAVTPALAGPFIDIPSGLMNFNGDGSFQQFPTGTFNTQTGLPNPPAIDSNIFGIANILSIAPVADQGHPVWQPADVGPNFEMTASFWNAVVSGSDSFISGNFLYLNATYTDGAHLDFISDVTKDFSNTAGPGAFNMATGFYPTANELPLGTDAGESLYLSMDLSGMSSTVIFNIATGKFVNGAFHADAIDITGGYGAGQFAEFPPFGSDGNADAFILTFSPTGWTFGADTDVRLFAVPEPAALISLCTGLALLGTFGLRRKA